MCVLVGKSLGYRSMSQQNKLLGLVLWITLVAQWVDAQELHGEDSSDTYLLDFRMPGVSTTEPDEYLCTALALNSSREEWLLAFEPDVLTREVHHMTLYGCADVPQTTGVWTCVKKGLCHRGRHISMWNINAPATALPPGVGFRVGGDSDVQFLILQMHYASALPDAKDRSGLKIRVTSKRQQFSAGIFLASGENRPIPANTPRAHLDSSCQLKSLKILEDIHVIGYRVHTHKLGTVGKLYRYDVKTGEYELIMEGDPHWVQAMYPREEVMTITPDDVIAGRCTYDTTGLQTETYTGTHAGQEMCSMYLLYYTENGRVAEWLKCGRVKEREVIRNLPKESFEPPPPNPVLVAKKKALTYDKSEVITYPPPLAHAPATRRVEEALSEGQR